MDIRVRSRVRWISLLILLLTLTASRANFPLLGASSATSRDTSTNVARSTKPGKQGEAVVPSRRMAETRRADWVRTLACQTDLPPSLKHFLVSVPEADQVALWNLPWSEFPPESTAPDYLRACSSAPDTHALPPPA